MDSAVIRQPREDDADAEVLVGRVEELGRVERAVHAGRPVGLLGPAGIGKTTVALEAVHASGRTARRTAAVDYLQSRPYLPITRLLGHPPSPGDAAAVAAEVRRALGDEVLVLDDLQWGDADTIELLPALAATGPLVVTLRAGGDRARRAAKHIETMGEIVELGPLAPCDAMTLARRWARSDHQRAQRAAAAAGGNPLALSVLARRRPTDGDGVAETLRAFVEACSSGARSTLARLSVHDPTVDAESEGVGELVEHQLVEVTSLGRVVPTADLFAELALASLEPAQQTALHRRLATTTHDLGEAAQHWLAVGDTRQAFDAARAAAAEATTMASRSDLLILAARAAPSEARWASTREAVAVLLEIGQIDATRALIAEVSHLEPPTRSDAIDRELMRARLAVDELRFERVLAIADAAIETFPDMSAEQRCSMLVMRSAARGEVWDVPGALRDAHEAKRVGREAGISTLRADLLLGALGVLVGDSTWRERLGNVFRESIRTDRMNEGREAARLHALALFFDGDVEGGMAVCNEAIASANRLNNWAWEREARAVKAINRTLAELAPDDVMTELHELLDDPALTGMRDSVITLLAIAEADRGHIEVADQLLDPVRMVTGAIRSQTVESVSWAIAEVAWMAGRLDRCVDVATDVATHASPIVFGRPHAAVLVKWARWELGLDPRTSAGPLVIYPVQRGLLDEARGVDLLAAGDHRGAADAFLAAARHHDVYLRRHALRCRWAAGEALRQAGANVASLDALVDVESDCDRHACAALMGRVRASLRKLRASSGAPRSTGEVLTPREREVLALVRQGLSTAAIAGRLQLRPSTVDSHVRKSMRRLGASTRREAALLAAER